MEDNPGITNKGEVICRGFSKSQYVLITDKLALKASGINLSPKTIRKYHHLGIHPNLITKLLGRLYISILEFERMIEVAKEKQNDKANRLRKLNT